MKRNATAAIAAFGLLVLGITAGGEARAQGNDWKAQVLIIGTVEDLNAWIDKPPEQRGGDAGRLRRVPAGVKIFFPIVASELQPPATGEVRLTADIQFFAPDGKMIWEKKRCCSAEIRDKPAARTVALGPAADVLMEPNDKEGLYTVRATVSDGKRTSIASETFSFMRPAAEKPAAKAAVKPAGPLLTQGEAPKKSPVRERDLRQCLELPTPAEVIKCTEKK